MTDPNSAVRPRRSWLAAGGALLAACAVALSAYAAHGAQGEDQARLHTAAFFAFGHGVALAALAPAAARGLARSGLALLLLGVLLFSGSLVFKVLAQWPTTLAPLGGTLLIAGWVLYAIDAMRK
ncbi:DUF423 domain-containing protein [Luteimonas gilva]|uniref:DUF423 domain-containing protein n=1 Tax=Luteimonas gilva TaxID=2572684 RepID=A0A4U5K3Y7_9GAMM|nr:DUF423 domain-containing protein [Luteimonas gilva]TKR33749.1 DUF423 domain-containing protein [Luteimonas gilva]